MTGQIADEFCYNGETYDLVGIDGEGLYTPDDFRIHARAGSTACWRGYQMIYDCIDGELLLDQMNVNTDNAPPINGIEPREGEYGFSHIYENLRLRTHFTGKIRLGKDFISGMYVHMGFQSAESYETVIELDIKNGEIIQESDLSPLMRERRENGKQKPEQPPSAKDNDVMHWISDRFSQDFKSE